MGSGFKKLIARIDAWLNASSNYVKYLFAFSGMIVAALVLDLAGRIIKALVFGA